jgi:hypothetical protein
MHRTMPLSSSHSLTPCCCACCCCRFVATLGSEDTFNQRGTFESRPVRLGKGISFFICYGTDDTHAAHDAQTLKAALEKPKAGVGAARIVLHEVPGLDHHVPKHDQNGKFALTALSAAFTASGGFKEKHELDSQPRGFRAIDDLIKSLPREKLFIPEIPPEAPPGWGLGNGDQWLIDHPEWPEPHEEEALGIGDKFKQEGYRPYQPIGIVPSEENGLPVPFTTDPNKKDPAYEKALEEAAIKYAEPPVDIAG